jgi:hypothetical protein
VHARWGKRLKEDRNGKEIGEGLKEGKARDEGCEVVFGRPVAGRLEN